MLSVYSFSKNIPISPCFLLPPQSLSSPAYSHHSSQIRFQQLGKVYKVYIMTMYQKKSSHENRPKTSNLTNLFSPVFRLHRQGLRGLHCWAGKFLLTPGLWRLHGVVSTALWFQVLIAAASCLENGLYPRYYMEYRHFHRFSSTFPTKSKKTINIP